MANTKHYASWNKETILGEEFLSTSGMIICY